MKSGRPMLSDRAIQIVAENKVRAAIDAGEFDNLPGLEREPRHLMMPPFD